MAPPATATPTFSQIMTWFRQNKLTKAELDAWLNSGTATDAQVHQFQQAVLRSTLSSDNKGSWLAQIGRDTKNVVEAPLKPVLTGINAIGDLANRLSQAATWERVGEFAIGALFLYVAIKAMFPGAIPKVAGRLPIPV